MSPKKSALQKSILVVRWIHSSDEPDEIAELKQYLGHRIQNVGMVRAKTKKEVCDAISSWLEGSGARLLYLGAHGQRRGLLDRSRKAPELLTWEELGRCFGSVPSAFGRRVEAVLGACYTSLAPSQWMKHNLKVPLSRLLCTAEEPLAQDLCDLIVEVLRTDVSQDEAFANDGDLKSLPDQISDLIANMPSRLKLRLFLRGRSKDKYAFTEISRLDTPAVEQTLASLRNKRQTEVLARAVRQGQHLPVPSIDELKRKRAEATRLNRVALDDTEGRHPARPLPGLRVRSQKRATIKRSKTPHGQQSNTET